MTTNESVPLSFTPDEIDQLGRTADALTAYLGKPVLAEVMDAEETGFEWVVFAVPLDVEEDPGERVLVQIGGPDARLLGNTGGLMVADGDVYDCEYLWAIQLSDLEGVRFIKVDENGDEVAWSENLPDVLPFALRDDEAPDDDDSGDDDDDDDFFDEPGGGGSRTLH
jgi:hypothetical protein